MSDPVEQDLARYLREQDEANALATLEERKVSEWSLDPEKCAEAVQEILENEDLADEIGRAMATGNALVAGEVIHKLFEEKLQAKLAEWAPKAVEADIEQAKQEAAEAQAEAREDYYDPY